MELEVGQKVGDYEILGALGAGGMGQVFRVRNTLCDRIEAMKVVKQELTAEPETAARFMAEIRILAGFTHPNIAQLRTAFQIDSQLVMIMELVEGLTVEHRAKRGRIPQQETVDYVLQLLSALNYAHLRGVVHRDVKPANLIVTPQGVVKLMDFGVAKSELQARLTRPGTAVGSLHYMSPEQMSGAPVDGRSDLYSVGVLLYELTAGRRPFEANGMYSIVQQQLYAAPQPPIETNPLISKPLNDLILSSLAKEPSQRIQSAEAFAKALHATTVRPPQPVRQPTLREPTRVESQPSAPASSPDAARRGAPRPVAFRPNKNHRSGVTILAASRPAVSVPPVRSTSKPPAQPELRPPSVWKRLGWVAAGAFAVVLVAGVAVEISTLLKTDGSSTTSGGSSTASPAVTKTTTDDQDIAQARQEMVQLESRANAVHAKLGRQPTTGTGNRAELNRKYASIHEHLQSAEKDLKKRDIVATRREMGEAQKEISTLESNFSK